MDIREIRAEEVDPLGRLMVEAYSQLDGFPTAQEQPRYYEMLANIGTFTAKQGAKVLVARSATNGLIGGVVYFADMAEYGSGGSATRLKDASGIRLLAVDPRF